MADLEAHKATFEHLDIGRLPEFPCTDEELMPQKLIEAFASGKPPSAANVDQLRNHILGHKNKDNLMIYLLCNYPKISNTALSFFNVQSSYLYIMKWLDVENSRQVKGSKAFSDVLIEKMDHIHYYIFSAITDLFSYRYKSWSYANSQTWLLQYLKCKASAGETGSWFYKSFDRIMIGLLIGTVERTPKNISLLVEIVSITGGSLIKRSLRKVPGCVTLLLDQKDPQLVQLAAQILFALPLEVPHIAPYKKMIFKWLSDEEFPTHAVVTLLTAVSYHDNSLLTEEDITALVDLFLSMESSTPIFCGLLLSFSDRIPMKYHSKVLCHVMYEFLSPNKFTALLGMTALILSQTFRNSDMNISEICQRCISSHLSSYRKITSSTSEYDFTMDSLDHLAVINCLLTLNIRIERPAVFPRMAGLISLVDECYEKGYILRAFSLLLWLESCAPEKTGQLKGRNRPIISNLTTYYFVPDSKYPLLLASESTVLQIINKGETEWPLSNKETSDFS